jgi:glutaredoxin-like protein NrdH
MKVPVTVYTTPSCVQCMSTKRLMDKLGIDYTVEDLTVPKNAAKLAEFKEKGLVQAPIVTTDTKIWSGFKYEKIHSLASYIKSMEK